MVLTEHDVPPFRGWRLGVLSQLISWISTSWPFSYHLHLFPIGGQVRSKDNSMFLGRTWTQTDDRLLGLTTVNYSCITAIDKPHFRGHCFIFRAPTPMRWQSTFRISFSWTSSSLSSSRSFLTASEYSFCCSKAWAVPPVVGRRKCRWRTKEWYGWWKWKWAYRKWGYSIQFQVIMHLAKVNFSA